jgi:hypothetical protein
MPFVQRKPPAVHVLFGQHGWLAPPQVPQLPFMHAIMLMAHCMPEPTHVRWPPIMPPTQQPPALHVPRSQQMSPGPPQFAQMPAPPPVQTSPV